MLKKFLCITLSLFLLSSLCGCTLSEKGNSLTAFCNRLNALDNTYQITPSGYLIDEENKTFTKFFRLDEKEIMLTLAYRDKSQITSLDIVFDNSRKNNQAELDFIKNSIYAFINDTTTADSLLNEADIENTIYTVDMNTKKTKVGNVEMLIDVTETGTVISVVQNTP